MPIGSAKTPSCDLSPLVLLDILAPYALYPVIEPRLVIIQQVHHPAIPPNCPYSSMMIPGRILRKVRVETRPLIPIPTTHGTQLEFSASLLSGPSTPSP